MFATSFRTRIFLGMGVVVVVCTVAMMVGVRPIIRGYAEKTLVDRLDVARKGLQRHMRTRYELLRGLASLAADFTSLKEALGEPGLSRANGGDIEGRRTRSLVDRDLVLLTNSSGVVVGADSEQKVPKVAAAHPMIAKALQGETYTGWFDAGESMFLVASTPVLNNENLLGAIVVGTEIDFELVDEISDMLEVEVLVLRKAAAAVWSRESTKLAPTAFAREAYGAKARRAGASRIRTGEFDRFAVTLSVAKDNRVVLLRPAEEIAQLENYVWRWMLAFGVLAAAVAILVSQWIARRLATPMSELAEAADRVASGRWDAVVNESRMDETARVGRAFNQMTGRVRQLIEDVRAKAEILQQQRNELEWANQAKNNFLITASHELRTPVTNIVSSSEILNMHGGDADEETRAEFLRMIDVEAARISQLVDQLLDVSRMDTGSTQLRFEEFDFGAVVKGLAEAFREGAGRDRPVSVRVRGDATCVGDRERLVQVVEQMLDNAVKFTPARTAIEVDLMSDGAELTLKVIDHGAGITSAEQRERIFDRFVQGGDILTEKPPGVGLGLSLARDVARAHAGDLRCEPGPTGGCSFVLELPVGAHAPSVGSTT